MWPQIVSSLAAGMFLAIAAVMLNSPVSLLGLALASMLAWFSHSSSGVYFNIFTTLGLAVGLAVMIRLFYLTL